MMITIYGLPVTIKYQDLKVLIKRECNIHDFILDHLISDGDGGKKVRVGLADDAEGSHLIKCLDGYRLSGNILRLVPVGKSVPGVVQQQSYARGNFPRSDYSNIKSVETKPTSWTENQWTATANAATYYQQPQPINTQYVQPQAASQIKQFDERQPVNRLQLQANVSQNYDYPGKTNLINLGPHRNVTSFLTQNAPATSNRYITYETSEKPVLIMKDNFQGPQTTQYLSTQMINYQNQHTWTAQQTQKPYEKNTQIFDKKYEERNYPAQVTGVEAKGSFEYHGADYPKYTDKRRIISPGKLISPHRTDRHTLQVDRSDRHTLQSDRSDRHTLQSDRHTLQSDRSDRDYDRSDRHIGRPDRTERSSDRHVVRPERNMDMSSNRDIDRPYGRNIDRPTERHIEKQTGVSRLSPSRQMTDRIVTTSDMTRTDAGFSQNIHKQAPRGVSPSTRKVEYVRGRNSSMDIHASRQSPCRPRHESPQRQIRYSPRHTDKPMEFKEARVKDVRPAYEPTATKAAIYTGGYRPNIQMDIKYPREEWQNREKPFPPKNLPDDRRDIGRMQKFDIPRASEQQRLMETEKKRSRSRSSRSPRRDRSPVRLRRHSPSPRSPRRSWALEKRRSEVRDPPSPPKWAAQDSREDYKQRIKFSDREIKEPVWKDKKPDDYRKNDTRSLNEQRGRQEAAKWKPLIPPKNEETARFVDDERYRKEGNYGRKEFEGKRTLSREDSKPYTERHVKDMSRSEHDGVRYKTDLAREEFAGRIEEKKKEILHKQELLQKEIDEVYKRAVDFTKQAVLYKKVEGNNDFRYKDERSREAREHEERHKYTSEEDRRGREDLRKEMYTKPHSRVEEPKFSKSRDPDEFDRKFGANAAFKIRRMKITDHISEKIFNQFSADVSPSFKKRVREELKLSIGKILLEMFEDKDVPFIDMLVKFNASHAPKDEERIFEEVMACLPIHYRSIKRSAKDESGIPAKMPRRSADANVDKDNFMNIPNISGWNYGNVGTVMPGNVMVNPAFTQMATSGLSLNTPVMTPIPTQYPVIAYQEPQNVKDESDSTLYLCRDNFQSIGDYEAEQIKSFLIKQLLVTETSQGWSPDFTLNKQNSAHRVEVFARDQRSKDWLLNLDFSSFPAFNVLIYTSEELWYERAAIWLPGHSSHRKFDPLSKLKLQNRNLEGVNIGKWKFIKKIIAAKGTRIYVDMPPSSARVLEKHKMLLSYELQKVSVFLKAVAVDKNVFDAGLNEASIDVRPNAASRPMPSLGQDPNIVKFALKGNKPINLVMARKIKDNILYKLFKYHELGGKSRTDFVKYGFCQPGFFGILPENEESRKWLVSLDMCRINRQPIVIVGADENKGKFFKMNILMPKDYNLKAALAFERLRQSNQGVRGLNFHMWKNLKLDESRIKSKVVLEVDMDLESLETLSTMNYSLDYVVDGHDFKTVKVKSPHSLAHLKDMIRKYKEELIDSYDVHNMDLESDSESVICLN